MSAGDPGIAGWSISPPRCCTNVGQMSPGTRQQPRGAECIKVQTCYAGDSFKWSQARCWGCEVDASQRRSCKRRKEVCTWSSEREKLPSTSCLFIVGPERSPSGSVLVIHLGGGPCTPLWFVHPQFVPWRGCCRTRQSTGKWHCPCLQGRGDGCVSGWKKLLPQRNNTQKSPTPNGQALHLEGG